MSLGGCVRLWIALWALEGMLTVAFVPAARLEEIAETEFRQWHVLVGTTDAKDAGTRAVRWLSHINLVERDKDAGSTMQATGRAIDVILERVRALLVLIAFRVSAWHDAAMAGTLCLLAAAVDGLMVRRRRAFTFASTNTALYNAAGYLLICASMSIVVCVAAPVAMPLAIPFAAALMAVLATWLLCAHVPGPATLICAQR